MEDIVKSQNRAKSKLTIEQIVKDNLCTGCGTCIAVCPKNAIALTKNESKDTYLPKLDGDLCNHCGICYKVCPGYSVELDKLNLMVFSKKPEDLLLGNYINCYTSHVVNYDLRYNCSSGGLVTQFLIFALEEGIIDGALVARMKKGSPFETEPFIARTREEIIEARGSKYCPVPANIALKEILESGENERFAVVGLPCHINGIRKAQSILPGLKDKIVLCLGLFCAQTISFLGTRFVLKQLNIDPGSVRHIDYRSNGWPGDMSIHLDDGSVRCVKKREYHDYRFRMFIPFRCKVCNDHSAELADISFADAWLPEFKNDKVGKSIVVTRNQFTEEILQRMISQNVVEANRIDREKVLQSQARFYDKKEEIVVRQFLLKLFGKRIPVRGYETSRITISRLFIQARVFLWSFAAHTRYLGFFLKIRAFVVKVRESIKSKLPG